jgi:hypothetical protein
MPDEPNRPASTSEDGKPFEQYQQVDSALARVITDYAAPPLRHCTSYEAREEAITYAILGWNLSLEAEEERAVIRQELLGQMVEEKREQFGMLFDYLIQRKLETYPDNRFYIIDYDLLRQGEAMEIRISSKYLDRNSGPAPVAS